jgi:tRNA1(Val) A37 N6-methylase TrmN6
MLRPHERIDDLLTCQLTIIQSSEVFSFSLDAVLLARFCSVPLSGKAAIADLCSGNGVIPLLLSTRTKASITGVEIQPRLYDMAVRSVEMNGLEGRIRFELADLREWAVDPKRNGAFDLVTVNPPYLPVVQGMQNMNEHIALARHEMTCTLEDAIAASSRLVRPGGKAAIVHRAGRLVDVLTLMREYRLEPKRIRFVHPRKDAEANMVLVEALRDGKPDVKLLPPLIVYEDDGQYCRELMDVFYGRA